MEIFSALLAICAGNSPVTSEFPHKDQWRGTLMFSLVCTWINGWVNNGEAGDLRHHHAHYDVIVMRVHLPPLPHSFIQSPLCGSGHGKWSWVPRHCMLARAGGLQCDRSKRLTDYKGINCYAGRTAIPYNKEKMRKQWEMLMLLFWF